MFVDPQSNSHRIDSIPGSDRSPNVRDLSANPWKRFTHCRVRHCKSAFRPVSRQTLPGPGIKPAKRCVPSVPSGRRSPRVPALTVSQSDSHRTASFPGPGRARLVRRRTADCTGQGPRPGRRVSRASRDRALGTRARRHRIRAGVRKVTRLRTGRWRPAGAAVQPRPHCTPNTQSSRSRVSLQPCCRSLVPSFTFNQTTSPPSRTSNHFS